MSRSSIPALVAAPVARGGARRAAIAGCQALLCAALLALGAGCSDSAAACQSGCADGGASDAAARESGRDRSLGDAPAPDDVRSERNIAASDGATPDAPPSPPLCSLDGKPLTKVVKDFVGLITFELYSALGTVDSVARRVAAAGVAHVRVMVKWSQVQASGANAPFDFSSRDAVIKPFTSRGVRPLLTLGSPPAWASSAPTADGAASYPPKATALAAWDAYVRATIRHYKPLGVHDYQVWNEPDYSFRTARPGGSDGSDAHVEYVKLLNRTAAIIRKEDTSGTIWGPDAVVGHVAPAPRPSAEQFAREALKKGDFDIFTFHTFSPAVPTLSDAVRGMLAQLRQYETMAHALRPGVPIAVTAAQVLAPPAYPGTCPYIGNSEQQQAQTLNDIYVCLANAGARHVFWYKTIDRGIINRCDPRPCPSGATCDATRKLCMIGGKPSYLCYDAKRNPAGTELSGVLGPHPLGKAAEYDGDCISRVDCSKLEHPPKAAYWSLRKIGRYVASQQP